MKIAIIGASGRTGRRLVRESLGRGCEVVAVCRETSAGKLDEFKGHEGFTFNQKDGYSVMSSAQI